MRPVRLDVLHDQRGAGPRIPSRVAPDPDKAPVLLGNGRRVGQMIGHVLVAEDPAGCCLLGGLRRLWRRRWGSGSAGGQPGGGTACAIAARPMSSCEAEGRRRHDANMIGRNRRAASGAGLYGESRDGASRRDSSNRRRTAPTSPTDLAADRPPGWRAQPLCASAVGRVGRAVQTGGRHREDLVSGRR